jgi:hypothetical protein
MQDSRAPRPREKAQETLCCTAVTSRTICSAVGKPSTTAGEPETKNSAVYPAFGAYTFHSKIGNEEACRTPMPQLRAQTVTPGRPLDINYLFEYNFLVTQRLTSYPLVQVGLYCGRYSFARVTNELPLVGMWLLCVAGT